MCDKSAQIQSMSWTVDKTVYELKHEGEKLAFYAGRLHLLAMTLAEWKILSGVIDVFGQIKAAQAGTTHHVPSGLPLSVFRRPRRPNRPIWALVGQKIMIRIWQHCGSKVQLLSRLAPK